MKFKVSALLFAGYCLATMFAFELHAQRVYLDPSQPVDARVSDLLSRMTLDEKIGQMVQADLDCVTNLSDIQTYGFGSMLSGGDSKPAGPNNPETWFNTVNQLQSWALKTRLKIPLIYGIDAVHGHNDVIGTTLFPHHIGMGATHDPALVQQADRVTAMEMAGTGIRWAFAPCIAVVQDERWGRTYESYSQDPALVSELGAASIRGFQGDELSTNCWSILACAKHFIGDGGTQDGHDQGNTVCDEATLDRLFLPPYQAAVQAGVGSIMVSYSSWNGVKMHAQKHLLTDVLKGELGFKGFLVSDWAAIDEISPDYKTDVETSINAGLDMIMIPYGPGKTNNYIEFINDLKELVAEGKVSQARIDDAVSRILRIKFQMGLFENPWTDPRLTIEIGSPEHRGVARQCVRESLVLLKNRRHTLPLSKSLKHIFVVGEAANDLGVQCGGWTVSWQGTGQLTRGTTIFQAIRDAAAPAAQVTFSPDGNDIHDADAVVVVVGEKPYAEGLGDRTNLDLSEGDAALIARAKASGAPVTTILLSGRPLILGKSLKASDAFIAAWLPGTEGEGVADVLFGDFAPTGKLPREWPKNDRQFAADHMHGRPLFPLGYGLTY
ncbi:MAG TPA: glycoside hydrolase family 3 N-terminal domain-containing protein [Candidatus Sulfotelmatobacter sp.]|nr:glycoside hydrolase family 3 N-terminal domain-containing protein [Candidatus Sulfotelmatobacter sp.]